jgi:RNA polymerase sigma factor (sigma-70 family)
VTQDLSNRPHLFAPSAQELGTFFTQHRAEFISHARRLMGASGDAEEIVQDSLVRVLLASPELESWEHAEAYFHKVIENLSIDVFRRRGLHPRLVVLDDATAEIEAKWRNDEDLSEMFTRADDVAIIREAISLLSPAERAALVMWEFEGRSTSEIAKELGVKEASVRHTVSRARANLRRLLSERIIDEERGLTALDLLSVTFRKAEGIARKSSKVALSAILVMTAFLGFNSLSPSDLMSEQSEVSVVQTAPREGNPSELFGNGEDQNSNVDLATPEVAVDTVAEPQVRSRVQNFNLFAASESFAGLDSEGVPTGFTVADSRGNLGVLFPGQRKVTPTETGLLLSNIVSTRSGATNVLINQSIVVDSFGTSYLAEVSVGINGGWQPLNLSFISSDVERLASGNYLLTAIMMVDSVVETSIKVSTGTSGTDLNSAPEFISTRVMLDPTKTKILAQAVLVSADSQGDGA